VGAIKLATEKAVPPFDFAQGGTAFSVATFSTPTYSFQSLGYRFFDSAA
jgi:hypothetical protein